VEKECRSEERKFVVVAGLVGLKGSCWTMVEEEKERPWGALCGGREGRVREACLM